MSIRLVHVVHIWPTFIFGVPKQFFFVNQLQGGKFAWVSFLGILEASCGVPPNPLETCRIWTRGHLFVALEIPGKMFLGLRHIIWCSNFFPFSTFANGCTPAPGTAIPHVPGAFLRRFFEIFFEIPSLIFFQDRSYFSANFDILFIFFWIRMI